MEGFMTSSQQPPDWIAEARKRLIRLFSSGRGWGYKGNGMVGTEPTALALLALRATQTSDERSPQATDQAVRWLASIQNPNGSVGISQVLSSPEWPTPYTILAWSALEECAEQTARATDWLLECRGSSLKNDPEVFAHDATIVGWPWVTETHSWIEPTAMAVLALRKQGLSRHERVREGLRLIINRSIPTGGWNYGNNIVYGSTLRAQPTDTGMALAALRGVHSADAVVASACAYLESIIRDLRSPQSLCWALLGLTAWERRPPDALKWLEEAYVRAIAHAERAPQLSYLLLAASGRSLELLGSMTDTMEATL
jgi:hypothetical protein